MCAERLCPSFNTFFKATYIVYTFNFNNHLKILSTPWVLAIINMTPDSFYSVSRHGVLAECYKTIDRHLAEGADGLDVGGCSTRPGAEIVSEEEEWNRIMPALEYIRNKKEDVIVSVDTFRANIARKAVERYGVQIVNDISGGEMDADMFDTVAALRCAYILMHMRGTPYTMMQHSGYDNLLSEITAYFSDKLAHLTKIGVRDVILDPGFGFAKTTEQNYNLLRHLHSLQLFQRPLLVGISRKTMLQQVIDSSAESALNATTAVHVIALLQNADLLRVHDVREAKETIKIISQINNINQPL